MRWLDIANFMTGPSSGNSLPSFLLQLNTSQQHAVGGICQEQQQGVAEQTCTLPNRSKWSLSSVSVMLGGSLPTNRRVSLLGLAVPLGRACLASQCLPPMLCSCNLTCCASIVLRKVTKPKPLDSPVLVLRMIVASCKAKKSDKLLQVKPVYCRSPQDFMVKSTLSEIIPWALCSFCWSSSLYSFCWSSSVCTTD